MLTQRYNEPGGGDVRASSNPLLLNVSYGCFLHINTLLDKSVFFIRNVEISIAFIETCLPLDGVVKRKSNFAPRRKPGALSDPVPQ